MITNSEIPLESKMFSFDNKINYQEIVDSISNTTMTFEFFYQRIMESLPSTLYKYFSLTDDLGLNKKKILYLREKKIYLSDPKDFNDPFDSRACFCNLGKEYDNLMNRFSIVKISAFTKKGYNCMPMWAHYSNNHQGFCVSYDINCSDNPELYNDLFPVGYSKKRIDISTYLCKLMKDIQDKKVNPCDKAQMNEKLLGMILFYFNIKHNSWDYENEYRFLNTRNGNDCVHVSPKEIYIGNKCNHPYYEELIKIAKNDLKIPVYKMELEEYSEDFNLIPKAL